MPLFRRQATKRFPSISWESSSQENSQNASAEYWQRIEPITASHTLCWWKAQEKSCVCSTEKCVWDFWIFSHVHKTVHVVEYYIILQDKTGSLGPSWSLWLWLIFSTLWGEGGWWPGGGAVNHSESGRGGQAPLTLCTVGGGYLTWDWAPLATDTLTHSVPKQRNAPAPSLSDSWSRSDSVGASVPVIKGVETLPQELAACIDRAKRLQNMDCLVMQRQWDPELFWKDSAMPQWKELWTNRLLAFCSFHLICTDTAFCCNVAFSALLFLLHAQTRVFFFFFLFFVGILQPETFL